LYYQKETGIELKNQYLKSRYLINFKLHSQLFLFPHLGQLQSQSNNEASHPLHLVYSAKSSLIKISYNMMKNKCEINILKIYSIFLIIMIHLFIFYTIDNKFHLHKNILWMIKKKTEKNSEQNWPRAKSWNLLENN